MKTYSHGGDIYNKKIKIKYDFSANINPMGMPKESKTALIENVDKYEVYPDPFCRQLISAISEKEKVDEKNIVCGNGAADLIYRLVNVIEPRGVLVCAPTFSEYERACKRFDGNIYRYELDKDFKLDRGILEFIEEKKDLDIIFLCSPNNPTGIVIDKEILIEICRLGAKRDITVVVDHCFIPFVRDSFKKDITSELGNFPNLVVVKAFTKIFAMAGLRLGYMMSSNVELIDKVFSSSQPWSVSTPAQIAGISALESKSFIEDTVDYVERERTKLIEALKSEGFMVVDSMANYILFRCEKAKLFRQEMIRRGILIRDCSNYFGLNENFNRIAVRSQRENDYFIKMLEELKWQRG